MNTEPTRMLIMEVAAQRFCSCCPGSIKKESAAEEALYALDRLECACESLRSLELAEGHPLTKRLSKLGERNLPDLKQRLRDATVQEQKKLASAIDALESLEMSALHEACDGLDPDSRAIFELTLMHPPDRLNSASFLVNTPWIWVFSHMLLDDPARGSHAQRVLDCMRQRSQAQRRNSYREGPVDKNRDRVLFDATQALMGPLTEILEDNPVPDSYLTTSKLQEVKEQLCAKHKVQGATRLQVLIESGRMTGVAGNITAAFHEMPALPRETLRWAPPHVWIRAFEAVLPVAPSEDETFAAKTLREVIRQLREMDRASRANDNLCCQLHELVRHMDELLSLVDRGELLAQTVRTESKARTKAQRRSAAKTQQQKGTGRSSVPRRSAPLTPGAIVADEIPAPPRHPAPGINAVREPTVLPGSPKAHGSTATRMRSLPNFETASLRLTSSDQRLAESRHAPAKITYCAGLPTLLRQDAMLALIDTHFDPGTFPSALESASYHFHKHGSDHADATIEAYIDAALQSRTVVGARRVTRLSDPKATVWRLKTAATYVVFSDEGKIISYDDRLLSSSATAPTQRSTSISLRSF